jgi:hypothetical protein
MSGATEASQSRVSNSLSRHAGTQNLLGLLKPIPVQVDTNVPSPEPATPQVRPELP